MDTVWDTSHECHNDLLNGLKLAGLYDHVVMSLVRLNIPVSPWHTDMRYRQTHLALRDLLDTETPQRCVLFQEYAPALLAEPATQHLSAEENPEQALWDYLRHNSCVATKGTKIMMGRYCNVLRKLRSEVRHFHQRQFIYTHCCLELDLVGTARFAGLLKSAEDAQNKPTSILRETPAEAALRKACANQMVVGLMDSFSQDCRAKDHIVTTVTEPWDKWLGVTSQRLRSTSESGPWLREQIRSDYLRTCEDTFACLSSEASLQQCEVLLPTKAQLGMCFDEHAERENTKALAIAHCAMGVNFCRLRRRAYMFLGPSCLSAFLINDDARAGLVIKQIHADYDNFLYFQELTDKVAGVKPIVERSPFNDASTLQVALVLKEAGWRLTPRVQQFFRTAHDRLMQSQICEDAFNEQKNYTRTTNRRGSLETTYITITNHQLLSKKHDFQEVQCSQAPAHTSMALDPNAFETKTKDMPREFSALTSFEATPKWYSPKAEHWTVGFADIVMLRHARAFSEERLMQHAWLGALLQLRNDLVVKSTYTRTAPWLLPLGCVAGSCFIAWPLVEKCVPGKPEVVYYELKTGVQVSDLSHALLDHEKWQARSIEWLAPLTQAQKYDGFGFASGQGMAVRPFATGPIEPILVAAARTAFGVMDKSWLQKLTDYLGVLCDNMTYLFSLVFNLVAALIPGLSDDEMLEITCRRMVAMSTRDNDAMTMFMDIEDAHLAFGPEYATNWRKLRDDVKTEVQSFREYSGEWKTRYNRVHPPAPKAHPKAKAKGKAKAKAAAAAPPPLKLPDGALPHGLIKHLVPPGGYLWRASSGSWQARYPPFGSVSRSWSLYGHREAAVLCLRHLWRTYLMLRGQSESDCPVEGLFHSSGVDALPPAPAKK